MEKDLILKILSFLPFNIKYAVFISFLKGKIYHYEESMEDNSLIYKRNATHLSLKGENVNEQLTKNLFDTKLTKLELITDGFLVEDEILEKFIKRRSPDILITDNLNALNWGKYKEIQLIIKYPSQIERENKLQCKKIKLEIKSYNIEDITKIFEVINIKGLDEIEICFFAEDEIYDDSSDNDSDYRYLQEYLREQTTFDNNEEPEQIEQDDDDNDDSIPDNIEPDEDFNPETGDVVNNEVLNFNTLDIEETNTLDIQENNEDLFNFELLQPIEKDRLFDDDDFEFEDIKISREEEEDEGEEEEEEDEFYNYRKNIEKNLDENEKKVLILLKKVLDISRASVIKLNSNTLLTFPFFKDKKKLNTLKIVYNTGFLNWFQSKVENLHLIDIYQDLIIENKNLLKCIFNSKYKNLIIKTKEPLNEKTFQTLKENLQSLDTDRLELGYVSNIYHFKYLYKLPIINPNIKGLVIIFTGNKMKLMNETEIEREYFKNNKNVYFKLL